MQRLFLFLWILMASVSAFALRHEPPIVYIYNWADYIPKDVIQKFEEETDIKVLYDVFDSMDTLEAQIFLNTAYDIVFPPAWPLFSRAVSADLFLPLVKEWIPNAQGLSNDILERLSSIDPQHLYGMPYLWGTTGIGYQKETLRLFLPEIPLDSWALFFDQALLSQLTSCHPQLLDGAVDVFQAALLYLGYSPTTLNKEHWKEAMTLVSRIRPLIDTFDNGRQIETLINGQSALIQGFSTDINVAKKEDPRIDYIIPKEGAVIWIDMMAIPKGAPHPRNAHTFINFLLRPDIMAIISNTLRTANPVPASYATLDEALLKNPMIFPDAETMQRVHPDIALPIALQRWISRTWLKIKMGHPIQ